MKEKKIIYIIIGIISVVLITVGVTYAFWILTREQTEENVVKTACLNVSMENELNDISLGNTFPILDEKGLKLKPFTFTIKNNCDDYADYEISLEMLSETNLDSKFVKIALNEKGDKGVPINLSEYKKYTNLKINGTKEGRTLKTSKLKPNEEKEYELRIWIDEDVTIEDDVMNKTYQSKIVVESELGDEFSKVICKNYGDDSALCYIAKIGIADSTNFAYDDTNDNNLRYIGNEPNNYIDIGDRDGEGNPILWRIIGIMNNVIDLEAGEKSESLLKIIRADSIGTYSWDTSLSDVNGGNGINEWSDSDIMKLLNPKETYLDEPAIGASLYWNNESGSCYNADNNGNILCDFTSSGISASAKIKLAKVRWNTGTFGKIYDSSKINAWYMYIGERSKHTGKEFCETSGSIGCNDKVIRKNTWDGYLGLLYPSDYGYAVGGELRDYCLTKSMAAYSLECGEKDWLKTTYSDSWTLTPISNKSEAFAALRVASNGNVYTDRVYKPFLLYPAGYLKSDLKIAIDSSDNYGSMENPFRLIS